MKKRLALVSMILMAVLVMISMLGFSGCKPTAAVEETTAAVEETTAEVEETTSMLTPKQGGTLNYGIESEIPWMDPHLTFGGSNKRVVLGMFEGLVAEDATVENGPVVIIPKLATSWDISDDGLVYTFHLREGVTFHDGTPFNADAVAFNVRRIVDSSFEYFDERLGGLKGGPLRYVESVKVIDDYTVDIILSQPWYPFLSETASTIAGGLFLMMSPGSIKEWGNEDVNLHPSGTGPFMFSEYVPGVKTVVVRNPNYWNQPLPYLDQINWVVTSEETTRVNALQSHSVDMITAVSPDQVEPLKNAGFTIVMSEKMNLVWFYTLNIEEEHMNDVRVRQAINYAIDREGMASSLLQDTVYPLYSMVPHTSAAFDPNENVYPYDPKKAKELLKEAGYPDGFTFTLQTPTGGSYEITPVPMAEWVQRNLADVGIDMKIETSDWVTYLGYWVKGLTPEVGMNQMSWGTGTTDWWAADIFMSTAFGNGGHINDTQIDSLFTQYQTEPNEDARVNLAKQAYTQATEQAYHVPICSDKKVIAHDPKVKGVISNWNWLEDYSTIWIEE